MIDMHSLLLRTASRWNIPLDLAKAVIARDSQCVYCARRFESVLGPHAERPSWEHIVNDQLMLDADNIALCCVGCNASKGIKSLAKWLESDYCAKRGISTQGLADIARRALTPSARANT